MASAVLTDDWVRAERRKQNVVVLAVILACLLVAFFPRNERSLFAFPAEAHFAGTITAPEQTSLRAGIFDPLYRLFGKPAGSGASGLAHQPPRHEAVLPASEPGIYAFSTPDDWRDKLPNTPLTFGDYPLPDPADLIGPAVPFGPGPGGSFFGPPPVVVGFPGTPGGGGGCCDGGNPPPPPVAGVPELQTWALMIMGIGAIAYRLRAVRLQAKRRRAHQRWRNDLVPKPLRAVAAGPWSAEAA